MPGRRILAARGLDGDAPLTGYVVRDSQTLWQLPDRRIGGERQPERGQTSKPKRSRSDAPFVAASSSAGGSDMAKRV